MPNNDFPSENATGYHELKRLQHLRLRIAVITRVDRYRMTVDIKWKDGPGGWTDVPITTAYWSHGAFMGVIPEEGATVITGFYHRGNDAWQAVILGFLPAAPVAARRIESQQIGLPSTGPDDPREEQSFIRRSRLRKTYEGQPLISSVEGSDVVVSNDVLLSNSMGNEICVRADDQMIVNNSIGHVINIAGGFVKMAPIFRNSLLIEDHLLKAEDLDNNITGARPLIDPTEFQEAVAARLVRPIVLPNGKKMNYIGDLPLTADQNVQPFTEHLTEIYEFAPLSMRITEDTDLITDSVEGIDIALITQVMGTLVGRKASRRETYGRVLKPTIFKSLFDSSGEFRLEEASPAFGPFRENEIRSTAAAYYFKVGDYSQAISKTGSLFVDIPRSTMAGPLGEGHSFHANLQGSAKVALGKESEKGTSLYLSTEGSIKAVVGKGMVDEQGEKGRSVDISTASGVSLEVLGVDEDGVSMRQILIGKKREEIGRDSNLEVKGNYDMLIHGVLNERVMGKKVESYAGDRNINIGENHKEMIIKTKQVMIGQGRKVTINSGGDSDTADELIITIGNQVATITLGNSITTIFAGNLKEDITVGNRETNITTGNYKVAVTTGAITITTDVGAVTISTSSGTMTLKATGTVQITGGTINVTGGTVNLGPNGPKFGVTTTAHPCLVTGAPHPGSQTVKAAL